MRYVARAVGLTLISALLASRVAFAGDYLTDAAQALQRASVYVASGTEGTDNDTQGKLQARLNKNDNIILVMLPSSAESELGVDTYTTASRLSEKLGNQRILGLAVGKKVVGFAPSLPAGVAADQMRRAESVSNDPVTALGTFVQNMHLWEAEHPQPTPVPLPQEAPQSEGSAWSYIWPFILILAVVLAAMLFADPGSPIFVLDRGSSQRSEEQFKFNAPHKVSEYLTRIAQLRLQVEDQYLRAAIGQLCVDTEAYFKKFSSDSKHDAIQFEGYLGDILEVITKYVEVQNGSRYYDDPSGAMRKGKEAVADFAAYVLQSCRRGSAEELVGYSVKTEILSAKRLE